MSAAPATYAPYVVGDVVLSDHQQALADATAPPAAATAANTPTPAQLAQAEATYKLEEQQLEAELQQLTSGVGDIGGILNSLANPTPVQQQIDKGIQQSATGNETQLGQGVGIIAGGAAGITANVIASGIGQAALAGLTALGHAIASGIVALMQWSGALAKAHVVPLAVAAVVLYVIFFR